MAGALFTPCAMNRKSEADASLFRFSPLHYGRGRGRVFWGWASLLHPVFWVAVAGPSSAVFLLREHGEARFQLSALPTPPSGWGRPLSLWFDFLFIFSRYGFTLGSALSLPCPCRERSSALVAALCQYLRALQEHAPHGSLCGYKYPKSFASASVFHQKNKESGRRCYVSFRLQRYKKFVNYKPFAY